MNLKHKYYRWKFNAAPYLPLSFPVHVDIELSAKCQLACSMCAYGTGDFDESKQGMMPRDVALDALYQAAAGGAKSVKLNFRGEPGLSQDLAPMTLTAKMLGFTEVAINTNLTSFSRRRLVELCEAGLDLMIVSIDGATQETYESIRVKGDFIKLIRNLQFVYKRWDRPRIRIQMVVQERNSHETDLLNLTFEDLCDEIVFQDIRQSNSGQRKKCPQPWQRLVVMWDGKVGACCHNWDHEAIIGQFPKQTLAGIWRNGNMKLLREWASHPEQGGPCRTCTVGSSYK